jgi:hypothetical protein
VCKRKQVRRRLSFVYDTIWLTYRQLRKQF